MISTLFVRYLAASIPHVAALLVLAGCSKPAVAPTPERTLVGLEKVAPLGSTDLSGAAPEYIGAVRANEETDLSFKVGGVIDLVGPDAVQDWAEGSPVAAGQVVGRLQQADFKNALASARAAAELAASNNERLRKLAANNVVSKQDADKGKADSETADALLRQAEQNLHDSELRASRDGVVLARFVNRGETASAGKPILRVGDLRTMSIELGVPDQLIDLFSVNKEIDVNISALPGRPPFRGRISEVGVAANNAGRLYRVVIKASNPDGLIKSGMTATVRAGGAAPSGAAQLLVPLSALISPPGAEAAKGRSSRQLAVFVVTAGKASLRPIETGDIIASSIIVTAGLKSGEEVVTKGAGQLHDGALVEGR